MSRSESSAPRWLVHLLRSAPAPIPWAGAARAAVALATPIAVGYALGQPGYGALASMGTLPTLTADTSGTYRYRALRLSGAFGAAVLGFGLGLLGAGSSAVSMPLLIGIAAISGLVSAAGSNASVAALQLFVFTVLGTGEQPAGLPSGVAFACFAAGAGWALSVALSGWPVRATSPERRAVADVYIELAVLASALSMADREMSLVARQRLTAAMNTAYDRLLTARSWLSGRDAAYRRLLNLLSASTAAVEASVAMLNTGSRPPREVVEHFTALATAVLADARLPTPPRTESSDPAVVALYSALAKIGIEQERARKPAARPPDRLRDWLSSLTSGPLTWLAALRLTLCVALAEALRLAVPMERSYWITLTVGIVLKPDFGSVFGRAVLRGLGTIVGVGVGAATLGLDPHGYALVALVALFAAAAAIGKTRNYGLLAVFLTPLIIVQMDLTAGGDWPLVLARLVDTVLGCAIVLVFGYLLWPGSLRPRVGGRLAGVADTVSRYLAHGLREARTAADRAERSRRRRRAYRGLADLRTAFQQLVVEPSPAGRQAAAWWPAIVALEQLTDAVTAVVVSIEHGSSLPAEADVRLLTAALAEFASAVRQDRDPVDTELPVDAGLADLVDRVRAVLEAVRGPDFDASGRG